MYIIPVLLHFNFQAAIWNRFPCPCDSKGLCGMSENKIQKSILINYYLLYVRIQGRILGGSKEPGSSPPKKKKKCFQYLIFNKISKPKFNKIIIYIFYPEKNFWIRPCLY